ncbi:MAG TPA: hypothetical protein VNU71_12390 [Burkholderiaceae bacterium]|nr:hypothetical protein [Burkholderiaceae bacterium]
MFLHIGRPKRLSELGVTVPDVGELKRRFDIAVLDDEPFVRAQPLRNHGFRITELGGDIKTVDQVAAYPIVICDIRGVGSAFGSRYEGAHVLSEIRKAYPDKYLIAFTGMTYDASYNEKLTSADKSTTKDASIDLWTQLLESGLRSVGDPRERWVRLRATLLSRGVDLYDVLQLEQAFIKSVLDRSAKTFASKARELPFNNESMDLILKFSAAALVQIIENIVK